MTRFVMTALLYASLAMPAIAGGLDAGLQAEIEGMREGDMRKLVVAEGRDLADAAFTDTDGTARTLAESNGKIRIVNFWATWCAPCREEKPALDALNQTLQGPEFEVIAVATGRNTESSIKRFNSEVGIESLTTYLDPKGTMAREAGVLGLPVSIIVDRDGQEIARLTGGADWSSESAKAILERLIGAGS